MSIVSAVGAGEAGADECGLLSALRSMAGVVGAEPLDGDLVDEVCRIESSIRAVSGGMEVENRGILDCAAMGRHYALFCDASFPRPEQVTMQMVDELGEVIGHDVPPGMRNLFENRDDVVWISDGFVIYPGLIGNRDARMVMLSSRLSVPGLPGADAVYTDIWVSMGEPPSAWEQRIRALLPYQVNAAAMALAKPDAIFMHCLPSYHDLKTAIGREVGEKYGLDALEVTDEVFEGPQSVVFDEAENRLHTIKAVMAATLQ